MANLTSCDKIRLIGSTIYNLIARYSINTAARAFLFDDQGTVQSVLVAMFVFLLSRVVLGARPSTRHVQDRRRHLSIPQAAHRTMRAARLEWICAKSSSGR